MEEPMRVIETHMVDGDIVARIEHTVNSPGEAEKIMKENAGAAQNVSFTVFGEAAPDQSAPTEEAPKPATRKPRASRKP